MAWFKGLRESAKWGRWDARVDKMERTLQIAYGDAYPIILKANITEHLGKPRDLIILHMYIDLLNSPNGSYPKEFEDWVNNTLKPEFEKWKGEVDWRRTAFDPRDK